MTKTTRAQRVALKQKWEVIYPELTNFTYRQFRKGVKPSWDGSGCIMVYWCGMWVGIEQDGYAHT
jgi:hypothetical protein